MYRAISIAKNAIRDCYPNPMVGCVIVYKEKIISEGFTGPFGGAHAEANAIAKVKNKQVLSKATLYVTLEPCAHFGKTPPCASLIVQHKIPTVVIGTLDPNPKVAGKGKLILENAGVKVISAILEASCKWHHRRFLSLQNKKRPYIILKWAQSADAFIAPPKKNRKAYWISSPASKQLSHLWRTQEHALLVGANTILEDNPSLDARLWSGHSPIPIYIDRDLSIPHTAALFKKHSKIICITSEHSALPKTQTPTSYLKINFNHPIGSQIANCLFTEGISSLLVEGGTQTLNLFIKEQLWDEARVFKSNIALLKGIPAPNITGQIIQEKQIENDCLQVIIPTF